MLPSFLTNLFWAQSQEGEREETGNNGCGALAVEHTASEEAGDWLLITTQRNPIGSPAHSNTSTGHGINQDCDGESICSDSSWVMTPAPVFQGSSLTPPINSTHPLEDLLIEHPTMSVYCRHGDDNNLNEQTDAVSDTTNDHLQSSEPAPPTDNNLNNEQQQQNRELVLQQNRQRQQLALHMQLPLGGRRPVLRPPPPPPGAVYGLKPQQLTRRALRRQNTNTSARHRGGKLHQGNRIQKCSFKAGRRRC